MIAPTRRSLLLSAGGAAALSASGLSMRVAFAARTGTRRFVLVILRGGLDGLHAVPAYGDPAYRSARGALALSPPGEGKAIKLDGMFALHPSLEPLMPLWQAGEFAIVHAVGIAGYSGRSHFDAQNVLETAASRPRALDEGWLNRAVAGLSPKPGALAVGQGVPLILMGPEKVASWAPSVLPAADEDYLARVARLYDRDPLLKEALASALSIRMVADAGDMPDMNGRRARANFSNLVKGAAALMKAPGGPGIAVFDVGGWDSHANQGLETGQIANRLGELAKGLVAIKTELGALWSETAVLVVTEFGRTVAINGSRGTDHGIAGTAFALGGTVKGGKVHGDFPGLAKAQLFEGRDLATATSLESLFKAVLVDHMGLDRGYTDRTVFAASGGANPPLAGLFA